MPNIVFKLRTLLPMTALTLSTVLTAGCAVGPDFSLPALFSDAGYDTEEMSDSTTSADAAHGEAQKFIAAADIPSAWWSVFRNKDLDNVIDTALKANPDLAAAQAALRQAEETTDAAIGGLFPTITGDFTAERQKTSGSSSGGNYRGSTYSLYNASVKVSYTLDVFGATRRQIEETAAKEDYQRFEMEATYLTLASNVVTATIQEASLRSQIATTEKIIADNTKLMELTEEKFAAGAIARPAVLTQQSQLQQAKATLPPLKSQLASVRHQLAVYIGETPNHAPKAHFELAQLKMPHELPLSLPSQLVDQRPDIRAAESSLQAANAAIGVAEANRLPQFTLSGDMGSVGSKVDKLFTPGSGVWSFGSSVAETIFDAGTLMHQEHAAEAAYDQTAAQYRKTVLAAFQNVADTLHALQSDAETLNAQAENAKSAHENLELVKAQFEAGAVSSLEVLTAEITAYTADLNLTKAQAQRFSDTAALYQALGGGWWNRKQDHADNQEAAPKEGQGTSVAAIKTKSKARATN